MPVYISQNSNQETHLANLNYDEPKRRFVYEVTGTGERHIPRVRERLLLNSTGPISFGNLNNSNPIANLTLRNREFFYQSGVHIKLIGSFKGDSLTGDAGSFGTFTIYIGGTTLVLDYIANSNISKHFLCEIDVVADHNTQEQNSFGINYGAKLIVNGESSIISDYSRSQIINGSLDALLDIPISGAINGGDNPVFWAYNCFGIVY